MGVHLQDELEFDALYTPVQVLNLDMEEELEKKQVRRTCFQRRMSQGKSERNIDVEKISHFYICLCVGCEDHNKNNLLMRWITQKSTFQYFTDCAESFSLF